MSMPTLSITAEDVCHRGEGLAFLKPAWVPGQAHAVTRCLIVNRGIVSLSV